MSVNKQIRVKYSDDYEKIDNYISLWVGVYELNSTDIKVLRELIFDYLQNMKESKEINIKLVNKLLFSTDSRRRIANKLKISNFYFNNKIADFKKKDLITESEGILILHKGIIPVDSITFNFIKEEVKDKQLITN